MDSGNNVLPSCRHQDDTLIAGLDGAFDSLHLTAQAFEAIEQFAPFLHQLTHNSNLHYHTGVGYLAALPILHERRSAAVVFKQTEY
jgi:hypothetical protein